MKHLIARAHLILLVGILTIASDALAQRPSDAGVKAQASIAHLTVAPRSIGFGMVKATEAKPIKIKNTGNIDANVTVVPPSPPFSVTDGGGSYSLSPGQVQLVSVQFAPTAKGVVRQEMAIQCANCNTASDDIITIHLSGNAKGPVATPTATFTTTTPTPTATPTPLPGTANALPFSVNGGPFDFINLPLASVTICAQGTSDCTTVDNVLIDTASFGLRIFGSQLAGLGITPDISNGNEIGECAIFGSGSTWGGISTVEVSMAGEPTITIPIQVIDDVAAFAPAPHDCTMGSQLMTSPTETGFNGLLGIGQGTNDLIFTDYFDCSAADCSLLQSAPTVEIVPNPVSSLPVDNNGIVVSLPSVSANGAENVNGTIYFGIGTESNNQPGAVSVYQENSNLDSDSYLFIDTTYKGITAGGLFDTGSNGYFFNDSSIKECSDGSGFYCPATTLTENATNKSASGSTSGKVSFSVSNADNLFNTNDAVFANLGGSYDGGNAYDGFDWGLPFFFGRTIYLAIDGSSSSLGAGPYVAY
jgi:hypothetical protein